MNSGTYEVQTFNRLEICLFFFSAVLLSFKKLLAEKTSVTSNVKCNHMFTFDVFLIITLYGLMVFDIVVGCLKMALYFNSGLLTIHS